jgi:hypothetical protein
MVGPFWESVGQIEIDHSVGSSPVDTRPILASATQFQPSFVSSAARHGPRADTFSSELAWVR